MTDTELRAAMKKLITNFGLKAALWGLNEKSPKPDDPTDKIMALVEKDRVGVRLDELTAYEHFRVQQNVYSAVMQDYYQKRIAELRDKGSVDSLVEGGSHD